MKTLPPRLIAAAILALLATALILNAGPWPSLAGFAGRYFKRDQTYIKHGIIRSPAPSQGTSDEPSLKSGSYFTIYRNSKGEAVCRLSTQAELRQMKVNARVLGLRPINHAELYTNQSQQEPLSAASGLTIILRATQQLQQNPAAVTAFTRAAQNWEALVMSPVTIYIDVDFGPTFFGQTFPSGVLGATGAPTSGYPYESARTNLVAEANGEGNATKQAVANALPSTTVPTDLGGSSSTVVSDPAARALGLLPGTAGATDRAAKIGFNSAFTFDFDPTDGISSGQIDFDAVATHEIGHALGFHSEAGFNLPRPGVWDLYRFRTGTTTSTFTGAQRIVTIGGSPDPLQYFFVPGNGELGLSTGGPDGSTGNGGDGWQSSHWKHSTGCSPYIGIMDPAIGSGCRRTITGNDTLALSYFGYNLTNNNPPPPPPPTPTPPANDNFVNAQTVSGCSGSVNGTSFSATGELGEPSHDPSDTTSLSPGHTVWYQWQAPSSGTTTFTTAGSDFDTIAAVYTGPNFGSLTRITFNDDTVPGSVVTSAVTFNATAGTTYQIVIDGWGGDSGGVKLNWTCMVSTPTPSPSPTVTPTPSPLPPGVRQVTLVANDLIYDPFGQKIYASVPSVAGALGNSITQIDPFTGTVGNSVFVGSEPYVLAISDNGQYIYVTLDGAAAVRRFDVASQTAGLQFTLGSDPFFGNRYADDLAVMPGHPESVAVSRMYPNTSPRHAGVGIYDNGIQRTNTTPTHTGSNVIQFSANADTLYGYNNETTDFGVRKMTVDGSGVSVVSNTSNVISGFGTDIIFDNGLLYSTSGVVFDPEASLKVGVYQGAAGGGVVPDSSTNRVYFVTGSGSTTTIKAYNMTTFLQTGSLTIAASTGYPTSLIKVGADGLAFRTSTNQVFLVSISAIAPVTATAVPTPTTLAGGIISLPLAAGDIVYESNTQKMYASLASTTGTFGNSIVPIDPQTGVMGTPVFMGSEPRKLAKSSNGEFIYVGLNGSGKVRRFDVASQTAQLQFSLGNHSFNGPFYVDDMEVMPGNPNAVAISRRSQDFSPRHQGVVVYDGAVMRPNAVSNFNINDVIEFSSSGNSLYGYNNETSDFSFNKMAVNASGASMVSSIRNMISGYGVDIRYDTGRIYSSSGIVVDPEAGAAVGSFTGASGFVVPDTANGRIYFLTGSGSTLTIKVFDPNTFVQTGSMPITGVAGSVASFIKSGDKLAFRTESQIYFVPISGIVPISPAPLPTPTAIAGGITRLSLITNDLVYDSRTQKVYASVPSAAGSFGNSLAPIDPQSGTISTPIFIGSEPTKLAISKNQQFIYVGMGSVSAVRKFDLITQTPGSQFPLGYDDFTGPFVVEDMVVSPDDPNTIAVSRKDRCCGPAHEGVAIYQNGVQRPTVTAKYLGLINKIDFGINSSTLYGYCTESTEFGFRKMSVTPSGVTVTDTFLNALTGASPRIQFDNGRVYSGGGRVINPDTGAILGTFPGLIQGTPFVSDSTIGRAYYVAGNGSSTTIQVFDENNFQLIGSLAVPGVSGFPIYLIRWGTNGLAFNTTGNQVYFIQTSLIPPSPKNASLIAGVAGSGLTGGTATLTATLSSGGSALAGKTVSFTINGSAVCGANQACPTTDASGKATLSNVSLLGINVGSYVNAVGASFAGDSAYQSSSEFGTLSVAVVPQVMVDANNHVIALDSVTLVRDPFSVVSPHNFSSDQRTRVIIFTSNLGLSQPSGELSVTAGGIPLTVEGVGTLPGAPDVSYITVKLDPLLTGNVQLSVTFRGVTSNAGVLSISP